MKKILIALSLLFLLSQSAYAVMFEYSNSDYGIQVKYPEEWSLIEDKTPTMLQLAISPHLLRSANDLKDADYIVTIAIIKNNSLDVGAYIKLDLASMRAANNTFKTLGGQNSVDINGRMWTTYKYQLDSLLTTKYVYKDIIDNYLIIVSSEEYSRATGRYTNEFEEIVKSISFAKAG